LWRGAWGYEFFPLSTCGEGPGYEFFPPLHPWRGAGGEA